MRDIRKNKKINIHKNNPALIGRFKQRTNATLILDLYDEFSNYVDLTNQEISIRVERPDGLNFEQVNNITKNSNILTVKLKNEVLEVVGKCRVELNLKDSEGQMNTADFFFEVVESVLSDDIVFSSEDYESLKKALFVFRTESNALMKKLDDNEKVRISNENTRKSQETSRVNAENNRVSKENERINQENTRKNQEETRKSNETTRQNQERVRQESENTRKSQETNRVNKENERKTNEDTRKTNESDRQTRFTKLESDGRKLIAEMNTAIDGTITREVTEARGNKSKLGLRLNDIEQQSVENTNRIEQLEDLTPVWQEHEGTGNITVNDSFDGVSKDLVIKGNTLQNLNNCKRQTAIMPVTETTHYIDFYNKNVSDLLDVGDTITLIVNVKGNVASGNSFGFAIWYTGGSRLVNVKQGLNIIKYTPNINEKINRISTMVKNITTDGEVRFENVIILKGDYTNNPILGMYFDSITSTGEQEDNKIKIRSVGKNLLNLKEYSNPNNAEIQLINNGFKIKRTSSMGYQKVSFPIRLKKGTYFINYKTISGSTSLKFDINGEFIKGTTGQFTIDKDASSIEFYTETINSEKIVDDIQIEEGTKATNYEQYREYIKEINIPFDGGLKSLPNGIADVVKGNVIVQTIKKIILDGSENWVIEKRSINNNNINKFVCNDLLNYSNYGEITNGLPTGKSLWSSDDRGFFIRPTHQPVISFKTTDKEYSFTLVEFKQWLQENPLTIYYELSKPIVHKVNQDINLSTFDTTTHITQENNILSDISFKAKVSLSSQAKRLKEENRILKQENVSLKESSIKTTEGQEVQDQKITTTMLANTELFEMMLNFMPMQLDSKQFKVGEMNMVEVYVTLIIQGDKTLEQVPAIIKPQVEAKLRLLGVIS